MKRSGFTMIELIFVIVILGILAAVAIPRLSATRDDAEGAKLLTSLASCQQAYAAHYTADRNETFASIPAQCTEAICWTVDSTSLSSNDGNVSWTFANTPAPASCDAARAQGVKTKQLEANGDANISVGGSSLFN